MYKLEYAVVKPLTGGARWRQMAIGDVRLVELFSQYKQVVAVLSNPFLSGLVAFDIETIRAEHGGDVNTFNQFLSLNGNKSLEVSSKLPVVNTRYAGYMDAFHAGYKITPTHPTASSTSPMPEGEKTWLLMTHTKVDYEMFYKNCLVNVNGFYHLTDYSDAGVFVVDGMKSNRLSGRNEIGILSFLKLGEISLLSIKPEMIYKRADDQTLKNNCYVETGVDLSQKTVMMVLGGYLHILDTTTITRISSSAFKIDFSNLPLVDRYYESYKTIDLSSLQLEKSTSNPDQISIPDLFSDKTLRQYLLLSQTFFVIIDNQEIFVEYEPVLGSNLPGVYTTYTVPAYPLILGAGRHETWWGRHEYGRYSLNLYGGAAWHGHRNYDTIAYQEAATVDAADLSAMGFRSYDAQFLKIGSDL